VNFYKNIEIKIVNIKIRESLSLVPKILGDQNSNFFEKERLKIKTFNFLIKYEV
jgi:hypothetical protein